MSDEHSLLPKGFGNYVFLQQLGAGGMGEVYLAKHGRLSNIEKYCVVKTLREDFTNDREYVARFIDEARVVVHLTHRNICQVFDVGRVDDEFYLAMEYISGCDLRFLTQRLEKLGAALTPDIAMYIMCEVLEALDYAHRLSDPASGIALNIVHRDVSLHNIMVSFEGEVKLIDFGLASSKLKLERTQPRFVLGKLAYMSPEQARSKEVDPRSDVFASGVILYELLTGSRYYSGVNTEAFYRIVSSGLYVPSGWDGLEPQLQGIVGRAVVGNPERRYASCVDFRDALVNYQYDQRYRAGAREIRALMEQLFAEERSQERRLFQRFSQIHTGLFHQRHHEERTETIATTVYEREDLDLEADPNDERTVSTAAYTEDEDSEVFQSRGGDSRVSTVYRHSDVDEEATHASSPPAPEAIAHEYAGRNDLAEQDHAEHDYAEHDYAEHDYAEHDYAEHDAVAQDQKEGDTDKNPSILPKPSLAAPSIPQAVHQPGDQTELVRRDLHYADQEAQDLLNDSPKSRGGRFAGVAVLLAAAAGVVYWLAFADEKSAAVPGSAVVAQGDAGFPGVADAAELAALAIDDDEVDASATLSPDAAKPVEFPVVEVAIEHGEDSDDAGRALASPQPARDRTHSKRLGKHSKNLRKQAAPRPPKANLRTLDDKLRYLQKHCRHRVVCAKPLLRRGDLWLQMDRHQLIELQQALDRCVQKCQK